MKASERPMLASTPCRVRWNTASRMVMPLTQSIQWTRVGLTASAVRSAATNLAM
jgi:hypothetical protein